MGTKITARVVLGARAGLGGEGPEDGDEKMSGAGEVEETGLVIHDDD
jgi:hypothetical protein